MAGQPAGPVCDQVLVRQMGLDSATASSGQVQEKVRASKLTKLLERRRAEYYKGEEEGKELSTLNYFLCTY